MAVAAKETLYNGVNCKVFKWTITDANPGGEPVEFAGKYPYKSMQVFGTFGTSGAIQAQGTNEVTSPSNWYNVVDPQGNAIVLTSAKIEQVLENVYQFRPYLTAGTGVTVTVLLLLSS